MDRPAPRPAMLSRLAYLDQCLTWRGQANRRDLIERFGISLAQAAVDFREYLELCQEPLPFYDAARRCYVAADAHRGLNDAIPRPAAIDVIVDGAADRFEAVPLPSHHCPAPVMRQLYQAMERACRIEVDYVSMSTGATVRQWIAPARIASDGERLHFRAWSYRHDEWRDYLPVRVSSTSSFAIEPFPAPLPVDVDWETNEQIELRPRSDLTPDQQRAVREEYGFDGDRLVIETRRALAFYVDRRWGLNHPGARLERSRPENRSTVEGRSSTSKPERGGRHDE